MRFTAFFDRGGRVIQEGIAVDTLLVGCGWKIHDFDSDLNLDLDLDLDLDLSLSLDLDLSLDSIQIYKSLANESC